MVRAKLLLLLALLSCTAGVLTSLNGCGGGSGNSQTTPPPTQKIQHIVFIVKENRSFDEYFGQFPGANGTKSGKLSNGEIIPLGHTPDQVPHDIGHDWFSGIEVIDDGKMDLFICLRLAVRHRFRSIFRVLETRSQVRVQEPRLSASPLERASRRFLGTRRDVLLSVRPLITVYLLNYPWFLVFEPERMYK
jgi:Phosphoesterase family